MVQSVFNFRNHIHYVKRRSRQLVGSVLEGRSGFVIVEKVFGDKVTFMDITLPVPHVRGFEEQGRSTYAFSNAYFFYDSLFSLF